jgi:hypothetical protein
MCERMNSEIMHNEKFMPFIFIPNYLKRFLLFLKIKFIYIEDTKNYKLIKKNLQDLNAQQDNYLSIKRDFLNKMKERMSINLHLD